MKKDKVYAIIESAKQALQNRVDDLDSTLARLNNDEITPEEAYKLGNLLSDLEDYENFEE